MSKLPFCLTTKRNADLFLEVQRCEVAGVKQQIWCIKLCLKPIKTAKDANEILKAALQLKI
jgi:hypothetical protein